MINRPPIGFIVEGHGEFGSYPSLVYRIVECCGTRFPVINAGGCGGVIRRLEEQLTDMVRFNKPCNIVVTVDLIDAIRQGLALDLQDLVNRMNAGIAAWLELAENDDRIEHIPERIVFCPQVIKFESWLIADVVGLKAAGLVHRDAEELEDVDDIPDPDRWLKDNLLDQLSAKNPAVAKRMVGASDPNRMRVNSRSFERFFDECAAMYGTWAECLTEPTPVAVT